MSKEIAKQVTIDDFHVGDVVEFDHHSYHHKGIISKVDAEGCEFEMICDRCKSDQAARWWLPKIGGTPMENLTVTRGRDALDRLVNETYAKTLLMTAGMSFDTFAMQSSLIPAYTFGTKCDEAARCLHDKVSETRAALADLKKDLQ
ncbi:hypothetical protein OZX67_03895 [Bifidobacterium sp. ESL0728]|uniref:hypothetical protein n=1 Tax=Bifidobacterium sp. ESL0728 TaxID=2983220 RepID=UPI0023F64702|nr:hypothetical protein [Bifidobacterium sp. ESL0728]WEV59690.1 hypothetical protein OZX67_03895 [Bifidobacterium sp. ESL0728]